MNYLLGIACFVTVAFLIAQELNIVEGVSSWSVLASFFFIVVIIKGLLKKKYISPIIGLGLLYFVGHDLVGLPAISLPTIALCALLSIGGIMFIRGHKVNTYREFGYDNGEKTRYRSKKEDRNPENDNVSVTMGEVEKYIYNDAYETSEVSCNLGSVKIYFDHASMLHSSATLHVNAKVGEVLIYVPKGWSAISKVQLVLGEERIVGYASDETTHTLYIDGSVTCGEFVIIYI